MPSNQSNYNRSSSLTFKTKRRATITADSLRSDVTRRYMSSCIWIVLICLAVGICANSAHAQSCTASGVGVTVCSPANGATIANPVHFMAAAETTCSKGVASMGIYVNNVLQYVVEGATLDTFLPLAPSGTEYSNTVVQEWDNCTPQGSLFTKIGITVNANAVYTYQYSAQRLGANTFETTLTPSNVNTSSFGKLFSCAVDGNIIAQPLYVPNLTISGAKHNVVYVSTENNSTYAFDADSSSCEVLWKYYIGTPVACTSTLPVSGCSGSFGNGVLGITSTPVIDPARGPNGAIYIEGRTQAGTAPPYSYYHGLHAHDLVTGGSILSSPNTIAATYPGDGCDSSGGVITFNPQYQNNRSALLYANGTIYVAFASVNDEPVCTPTSPHTWHGWVLGINAGNLQNQQYVYNDTPNSSPNGNNGEGGIWGSALAADLSNFVYTETGNGTFDNNTSILDFSFTAIKLTPNGNYLSEADYFTPKDLVEAAESGDDTDEDLGTQTTILLPAKSSWTVPNEMVGGDKPGNIYVLNSESMGGYEKNDGNDDAVQEIPTEIGLSVSGDPNCDRPSGNISCDYGTPAYWNNYIYFVGVNDNVKQFTFGSTGLLETTPKISPETYGYPGATPTISANGNTNGIVWAVWPSGNTAILRAYNATNVATELWNSSQKSGDTLNAPSSRFAPPMVVNGKVYVGTSGTPGSGTPPSLVVYGLK
jgi:hypothetical protein